MAMAAGKIQVRLAWSPTHFHLHGRGPLAGRVQRPDSQPGDPDFWKQDHVEFRVLQGDAAADQQLQIILTSDGRWQDNVGGLKGDAAPECAASEEGEEWVIDVRIPVAALGLTRLEAGQCFTGVLGGITWEHGTMCLQASSPVELGYSHSGHFGKWALASEASDVRLHRVGADEVILENVGDRTVSGWLTMTSQAADLPASAKKYPLELPVGRHRLPVEVAESLHCFTRHGFTWGDASGTIGLGSVCRRGRPAPIAWKADHPGLLFGREEWPLLRKKRDAEPFCSWLKILAPEKKIPESVEPNEGDSPVSMDFTPGCAQWFRVASESMLRDGKGRRNPVKTYLWELHSPEGQAAWEGVVASVDPRDADMDVILRELNALLRRRDFYQPTVFEGVCLPREGRDLLARGVDQLSDYEVTRLNRILYQSSVECILNFRMRFVGIPGSCLNAWLVDEDSRWIERATWAVRAAAETIFDHEIHLHEGMCAQGLALAYDVFHPYLSEEDRRSWLVLIERLLVLYVETAENEAWTVTTLANANAVGNSGCGLLALAAVEAFPDLAEKVMYYARRNIWSWLDYCQGPDGGNTEGAQYWHYAWTNFLYFAIALERVTGSDDGFLEHPALRNSMAMVESGLCNDGALSGVNDTVPFPSGGPIAWYVGQRFGDRLASWYGDHVMRWISDRTAAGGSMPGGYAARVIELLAFRPAGPLVEAQPALPTDIVVRSVEVGMLRSGSEWNCRWTVGLKGARPPYTHHNQSDTGSFFADLRGQRLILDPGYYKSAPMDHAVPLIDGRGPKKAEGLQGYFLESWSRGDLRFQSLDSSAAYERGSRVRRHLLLVGEAALVIIDDIRSEGPVTMLFPCGAPTTLAEDGGIRIDGGALTAQLSCPSHPDAVWALSPERPLNDIGWGYRYADCRYFPTSLELPAGHRGPIVTVLQDITEGNDRLPVCEVDSGQIELRLPSGRCVGFVKTVDGWQVRGELEPQMNADPRRL